MEDAKIEGVYMTAQKACAVLGIGRRWFKRQVKAGKIRCVVQAVGRGNKGVYEVPRAMLPKGYREENK